MYQTIMSGKILWAVTCALIAQGALVAAASGQDAGQRLLAAASLGAWFKHCVDVPTAKKSAGNPLHGYSWDYSSLLSPALAAGLRFDGERSGRC